MFICILNKYNYLNLSKLKLLFLSVYQTTTYVDNKGIKIKITFTLVAMLKTTTFKRVLFCNNSIFYKFCFNN